MDFIKLFFRSMRLASRLDHNRPDNDPARAERLVDELCAEQQAPRRKAAARPAPVTTGSVPHAA